MNPEAHTTAQEAIITALARAFAWVEMLECGEVASVNELAEQQGVDPSLIGRTLRLATLAPAITQASLANQEPSWLYASRRAAPVPAASDQNAQGAAQR